MTANEPVTSAVAEALREGLANAQRFGRSSVSPEHLQADQFETLVAATLAHLRSVPGKPCEVDGWSKITTRDAAVMTWWAEVAALTQSERRRLAALRSEVYGVLAERNLIEKDARPSTSLLVSPAVEANISEAVAPQEPVVVEPVVVEPVVVEPVVVDVEPAGAWMLKLSPFVYDVNRVFAAPDARVHVWSVEDHVRAAGMQAGDRVYLWLDEGDLDRASGVWGVGHVAGPAVLGVADDGWLDYQAASRASVFAVVNIELLDSPISRQDFVEDARLAEAEVILDPYAPNPGVLTASEEVALAERLTSVERAGASRVA